MYRIAALLTVSLVGLCACAAGPGADERSGEAPGTGIVLKLDAGNPSDPASYFAYFPLVQGSIIGTVRSPPVMVVQSAADGSFTLPVEELARRVRPLAKPLLPEMVEAGMSAQPQDLRVARVGTFVYENDTQATDGAGILDPASHDSIALIYVDRPGILKGTLPVGEPGKQTAYAFDLELPAAGLHWIRFKSVDSRHTQVTVDDAVRSLLLHVERGLVLENL